MAKKPFELDPLVPSQFRDMVGQQARGRTGEYRLLIAVLRDAVDCFRYCLFTGNRNASRLAVEAEAWIMGRSEKSDAALSFEYVCSVLDLDPEYLRQGLQRWREAAFAKAPNRAQKADH